MDIEIVTNDEGSATNDKTETKRKLDFTDDTLEHMPAKKRKTMPRTKTVQSSRDERWIHDGVLEIVSQRGKFKVNPYHYVDKFLNSYSRLVHLFPQAKSKEITETMSAVECLYRVLRPDRKDRSIVCYVVADGCTPRTGAVIAVSSAFTVYSIDPIMNMKRSASIDRLEACKCKCEDFDKIHLNASLSIIVAVHSHANLRDFWNRVPDPKIAVAIPCCVPQETSIPSTGSYSDPYNLSPARTVVYWDTRATV